MFSLLHDSLPPASPAPGLPQVADSVALASMASSCVCIVRQAPHGDLVAQSLASAGYRVRSASNCVPASGWRGALLLLLLLLLVTLSRLLYPAP